MESRKKAIRKRRVQKMNTVLRKLYPKPRIALNYGSDFECLVAVQLSAQCTDARVNEVTKTLFATYRTTADYADTDQQKLERIIYPCGFYRNKSKNIIGAARMVEEKFGGALPKTMEEMLSIPGVARKTANVLLSNLYGVHEGIAVDTHVRRFAIRFGLTGYSDPVRIERDLMEIVPKKDWWYFNHRLVHYGRDYCPARPHPCKNHPLTALYPKAATIWPRSSLAQTDRPSVNRKGGRAGV